ncbi:GNAT family N-acetyltransferase [bacterium SCSIO 12643]|nr:GNAT family N-acetyltransferase [bacterium SCSIO 12643]
MTPIIFNTDRLEVRELQPSDKDFFIELLSAPEIINPIPQPQWSTEDILKKFESSINYSPSPELCNQVIWGIYETDKTELIGLCALLTNDLNQRGIGYRFRSTYWGQGYGTEITKGMISFCFSNLGIPMLTADVNIENLPSVKILEKFFHPAQEFYNDKDHCTDRRYELRKSDWSNSTT